LPSGVSATINLASNFGSNEGEEIVLKEHDGTIWRFKVGSTSQYNANPHPNNVYYWVRSSTGGFVASAYALRNVINSVSAFSCSLNTQGLFTVTRTSYGLNNLTITNTITAGHIVISNFVASTTYSLEVFDDDFTTDGAVQTSTSFCGNKLFWIMLI
jgi:hypothetical protein